MCLTVDLLENFDNHPPIVLPSAGFKVDLESECVDDSIYRHLLYIRHFLWGLRTKTHGSTDRQEIQVCFPRVPRPERPVSVLPYQIKNLRVNRVNLPLKCSQSTSISNITYVFITTLDQLSVFKAYHA